VVFEIASEGTWLDDLDDKYDQYERLGVREYFLFDPEGVYLNPPVQGYRLTGAVYRRMRTDALESELGFGLRAEGAMLRLTDARSGRPIPTRLERAEQADAERLRADAEKERADALAAEVERLKARLKELGDPAGAGP
jgi:hypothetical protein